MNDKNNNKKMFGNMQQRKGFRLFGMLFLWFLTAMCGTPLQAQFAGPRKTTLLRGDDGYADMILGTPGGEEYCYYWTFKDGSPIVITSADDHSSRPNARFTEDTNIILAKRLTEYGVEEDQIMVILKDDPTIESVNPTRLCYTVGEQLNLSDFEIVTDPPEFSPRVTLTTRRVPAADENNLSVTPIHFELVLEGEKKSEKDVHILVYDKPERKIVHTRLEVTAGVNMLMNFGDKIFKESMKKSFEKIAEKAPILKGLRLVSFVANITPPVIMQSEPMRCCCDDGPKYIYRETSSETVYGGGISVTVPIVGDNSVAALIGVIDVTGNFVTSPYNVLVPCDASGGVIDNTYCHGEIKIPGRVEFNLTARVGGTALLGALTLSSGLSASMITETSWDVVHSPQTGKRYFTLGFVVSNAYMWVPDNYNFDITIGALTFYYLLLNI